MRERLTVAFVVLSILLLLGAGVVRSFVLRDVLREQEVGHLRQEVELVSQLVHHRESHDAPVDRRFLATLVGPGDRLRFARLGGRPIEVHDDAYDGNGTDDLSATAVFGDATVTVSESDDAVGVLYGREVTSIVALFLLAAVVAGVVGFLISSALSRPFQRLAVAASALGRGRFDLELPRTRIPEAQAISTALGTSAHQLEDRVHREREFAEHASHVLRTPLTGLRLELEDLTLRDDVPEDVKEVAGRCLGNVEQVGSVAGELVELIRRDSLVAGAELPMVDLATQLAQRWADRLGTRNRALTAAAEGELDPLYTPGPVEYVTDLLLADVVRRGAGPVRLVFHGEQGGHLRIHVRSEGRAGPDPDRDARDRISRARAVAESLGGRVSGEHPADGIDVLLPRR